MSENTRQLADQDERDTAAFDLSTNYVVEAAAGTGKTTLLVNRILYMLRETDVPASRIVAITFTEKAAGELKSKLRVRLEEEIRAGRDAEDHYWRALHSLDSMPVSTIHAFCRDLIAEYPVEAGIDPSFTVADESVAEQLKSEVWEDWIREQFSRDCRVARPWLNMGGAVSSGKSLSLEDIYRLLLKERGEAARPGVDAISEADLLNMSRSLAQQWRDLLSVTSNCTDTTDGLALYISEALAWLTLMPQQFEEMGHWLSRFAELKTGGLGSKSNWPKGFPIETARVAAGRFNEELRTLREQYFSRVFKNVVDWLRDAATTYEQEKERRAMLDFDDLLIRARNMLASRAATREELKERFAYILVDEFQDTDPLQAEIVWFLSERAGRASERWEDVELDDGKLFIVGDPKQSIYRFRRADLDLYGKSKELLCRSGGEVKIHVNFRCDPGIIREVNAVFDLLMTKPEDRFEPEYISLAPAEERAPLADAVTILTPPAAWHSSRKPVAESARAESMAIASHIRAVVDSGTASYGDVAILFPVRTHIEPLEDALRSQEIPFDMTAGRAYGIRPEIQSLRCILSAIQNPFDSAHVAGALRSPFFACSDDDLLQHRLAGGTFNYSSGRSGNPQIESAFGMLRQWHDRVGKWTSAAIISDIYERTPALAIFAMKPRGEGRVANFMKALDISRALDNSRSGSIHDLIACLRRMEESSSREEDSPVADITEPAVHLLTFHKAKGLEFPVVLLYDLGTKPRATDHLLLHRMTGRIDAAISKDRFYTDGFADASVDDRARARFERMRLLYVAMTRAKQRLVLPLYWRDLKSIPDDSYYAMLMNHYASNQHGVPVNTDRAMVVEASQTGEAAMDDGARITLPDGFTASELSAAATEYAAWLNERTNRVAALYHGKTILAPSALTEGADESADGGIARRNALQLGRFVHRVLERIDLPEARNVAELLVDTRREVSIDDDSVRLAERMIRNILRLPLFTVRIAGSQRIEREMPLAIFADDVVVEGSPDLVFWENGVPVIVDFKTDSIDSYAAARQAERHRAQLSLYAAALSAAGGVAVREAVLCFLRPACTVSLWFDA